MSKTTAKEREEFFYIAKKLIKSLKINFNPSIFNYAALGNTDNHLHVHIIPRYKKEVEFDKQIFIYEKWLKPSASADRNF